MVAKYKINDKVILTDSGGGRNLFVDGAVTFNDSDGKTLLLTNTNKTLAPDFFTNYFPALTGTKNTAGYSAGGSPPPSLNTIDKFPFASDANASDVGDLTTTGGAGFTSVGSQSSSNGYVFEGSFTSGGDIEKFPFASDGNATAVGDFDANQNYRSGTSSDANGYSMNAGISTTIDRFSFASDGNATSVGNNTQARYRGSSQSSSSHGYLSGGYNVNVIDKMPFSSEGTASDVGDLLYSNFAGSGASSDTNGYVSGGFNPGYPVSPSSYTNIIQKFPFSSDDNSSDVGDLTNSLNDAIGQSSTASGYASGGFATSATNVIQKFAFASDQNATDVGDLTVARGQGMGVQV